MTETKQTVGLPADPFDPETFIRGGGLWDGRVVTITGSVAKTEALKYSDGKPVLDKEGRQTIQTGLIITGVSDGADEKERRETYSSGDKLVPTSDGEGFVGKDGTPPKFYANSNLGKFAAALRASGFDTTTLLERLPDGSVRQRLSRLVGTRFLFKGEPKMDRAGKVIKDKRGYDKHMYLPVRFIGRVAGAQPPTGGTAAGTVARESPLTSPLAAKATASVIKALAGGPLTKVELVQALAQALASDSDSNGVIGLVVRDDFHIGKPWTYDGLRASLTPSTPDDDVPL